MIVCIAEKPSVARDIARIIGATADHKTYMEGNEKLTELIGRLPDGYRTVLNLYVFEGLTHKEIAKRLNIKENSSASQYARARTMLARMIRKVMNTE